MDHGDNRGQGIQLLSAFNLAQACLELSHDRKELRVLIHRFCVARRQRQSAMESLVGFRPPATSRVGQPDGDIS